MLRPPTLGVASMSALAVAMADPCHNAMKNRLVLLGQKKMVELSTYCNYNLAGVLKPRKWKRLNRSVRAKAHTAQNTPAAKTRDLRVLQVERTWHMMSTVLYKNAPMMGPRRFRPAPYNMHRRMHWNQIFEYQCRWPTSVKLAKCPGNEAPGCYQGVVRLSEALGCIKALGRVESRLAARQHPAPPGCCARWCAKHVLRGCWRGGTHLEGAHLHSVRRARLHQVRRLAVRHHYLQVSCHSVFSVVMFQLHVM